MKSPGSDLLVKSASVVKIKSAIILIVTVNILVIFIMIMPALSQSTVEITRSPLTIPTYQVAPPDKNPMFFTGRNYQGAQGHIYPHPIYDVLLDKKEDRTYNALYIDNEYTRLCVLPELGGRIFYATDKTDGYDFFYHQHVIKPALIGMTGAWISGGVEWNIPDHHRATSQRPIDYTVRNNDDGSKTIWVGETELSRGLKWSVGLSVHPGKAYVEATVNVINPTPFQQSFLYWANVSVFANENYQVIFPPSTQFGVQHAKGEFTTWPMGSGMYGGIDRSGTDLSWWKNHPNPASIFAWNFSDDFLAGYDHKQEAGTVHVANHNIVNGKKFFLWGNNPEAKMWEKMLTDSDGQYLELMVGAYSDNQPDYSWIAPGETRVFKQYWYPIKKIGGVKNATTDAAINVERKRPALLSVGLNTTAIFKGAKLVIKVAGKVALQSAIDIDPANPYLKEFPVDPSAQDTDIEVILFSKEGRQLVSYQPVKLLPQEMPNPIERPREPKDYATNEELYFTGLRLEQFRNATIDAMPYYAEVLTRDSLDYNVNNILGIHYSREGKFSEAETHLQRAVKRVTKNYTKPKDGEAFYNLGIVYQFEHRIKDAADNLWKATWYKGFQSPAYFRLAQIACLENNYDKALDLVEQAIATQALYTEAITLKAYLLRKKQNRKAVNELTGRVLEIDPLDHWAGCERVFNESQLRDNTTWSGEKAKEFDSLVANNVQSILKLALQYGNIGAYTEALQVLDHFIKLNQEQSGFPMLFYYKAFYLLKTGDSAGARNNYVLASAKSPDYCFPFRLEELEILASASQQQPADPKPYYYLGDLHYYLNQKDKAMADWKRSVELDSTFSLAYRNLGFAYDQVQHDFTKAIDCYQKAIALNDKDARLFAESDRLKQLAGLPATERLKSLEDNLTTVLKRDDAVTRLVELYNIVGKYDKALSILNKRHFHVWEGGGDIHNNFIDAALLSGIDKMRKKDYGGALRDFELASTYPDNLEVGKPAMGERDAEINFFIAQAYTRLKNPGMAREFYSKVLSYSSRHSAYNTAAFFQALAMRKLNQNKEAASLLDKILESSNKQLNGNEGMDFFSKFGSSVSRQEKLSDNYMLSGLAYLGKGDSIKAKEQFEKAIETDHNNSWAKVFMDIDLY